MALPKGLKGLKEYNKYNEDKEARRIEAEANRLTWVKLDAGQSVKMRPLQELDDNSKNYSAKNGQGFIAVEHVSPDNYQLKILCTAEEDGCVGCEQHKLHRTDAEYKGGWKQKPRLYLNVLIDDGKNDPYVAVLSQGTGDKSITPQLLEYAEDGSITDRWYKLSRKGGGLTTSYLLKAEDKTDDVDVEAYEMQELTKAVRDVPYEDQTEHFGLNSKATSSEREVSSPAADDERW